ncbi:MAG: DUF86 domain-containing protein [Nitrospirae bacterium]|nr:MAG: DUF86 domain-containing protein [Nitrospirota bacterium]
MSGPVAYDRDVVLAKIDIVRRCLAAIAEATGGNPEALGDWMVRDVFVLNLERAVQAVIDLVQHLIAANDWGLPDSSRGAVEIASRHGIFDAALARRVIGMVGFRNIAVHEYRALDDNVLRSILTDRLSDLERAAQAIHAATLGQER